MLLGKVKAVAKKRNTHTHKKKPLIVAFSMIDDFMELLAFYGAGDDHGCIGDTLMFLTHETDPGHDVVP